MIVDIGIDCGYVDCPPSIRTGSGVCDGFALRLKIAARLIVARGTKQWQPAFRKYAEHLRPHHCTATVSHRTIADMRIQISRLHFGSSVIASIVVLAAFASSASAATPIGQSCAATNSGPPVMFQSAISSGTPYTAQSDGILTKWGVNTTGWGSTSILAAAIGAYQGGQWSIVTGSPYQFVPENALNEYPSRIAVAAGQTLGLLAINSNGLMCSGYVGPVGDVIDYRATYAQIGSTFTPDSTIPAYRVSVFGTIEPDVDKDGYGDDSQDACPQSAALQNPCPVLSISQKLSASRSAISVLATASVNTSLTASAAVKLPKIGRSKAKTVKFKSRSTKFTAGKLKAIKLKLPASVRRAVSAGKSLKVTVTLTGNGLANTATTKSTIKLKR